MMKSIAARIAFLVVLLTAVAGSAQPAPEDACESQMVAAEGKYFSCKARVFRRYVLNYDSDAFINGEYNCMLKMLAAWNRLQDKAEAAGATCRSTAPRPWIQDFIDECMGDVWAAARGTELPLDVQTCNEGMDLVGTGARLGSPGERYYSEYIPADTLFGIRVNVPYKVVVTGIGVEGKAAGPSVKMAIYSGVDPEDLVVATGSSPLPNGELVIDVPMTVLEPGYYWIMSVYDAPAEIGKNLITATRGQQSLPFASPFPEPAGPLEGSGGDLPSLFLQLF